MSELEKRIALLERKVAREKRARKEAEQRLESHSLAIYHSNHELKKALQLSNKKQKDLEFLTSASEYISSDMDVLELLQSTAELAGNFAQASNIGFLLYDLQNDKLQYAGGQWLRDGKWTMNESLSQQIFTLMPEARELLEQWLVVDLDDVDESLKQFLTESDKWFVAINFELLQKRQGWLCLTLENELLDEETLYVLDTAKNYIRSGLNRRIAANKLQHKNLRLEESLKKLQVAQQQLVHSEKMASLGQLAAGVAHEINNPIGFIRSNLTVLKDYFLEIKQFFDSVQERADKEGNIDKDWFNQHMEELNLGFVVEDCEEIIKDNAEGVERVAEIVASLKTFSHGGDSDFAAVNLNDCVNKALKIAWNALKYEHQIDISEFPYNPVIFGNSAQLQQVLVNLLVNAGQAIEGKGHIKVDITDIENHFVIAISDNGIGMETSTIEKLFTPFFTTKAVGEGTGLGLSVSLGIIESHNGRIDVESEVGVGTTFRVFLPKADLES